MMTWKSLTVATAVTLVLQATTTAGSLADVGGNNAAQEGRQQQQPRPPPHILFVLIDDLGWGDVGFHNDLQAAQNDVLVDENDEQKRKQQHQQRIQRQLREVQTPIMDRLAQQEGLELNRHYVHHSCTGTRTSLQSGRLPVHVQTSLKNPEDPSSGMPRNLTGLAEHLKRNELYATHYVGKWDVGMATPKHTPKGRGYDTSLHYFEHKNDYWTQECMQSECCRHHLQQQGKDTNGGKDKVYDLWDTDHPARTLVGTDYEEFIFQRRMLEIIDQHAVTTIATDANTDTDANTNNGIQNEQLTDQANDAKAEQQPLFLFYAPHVAHCPLQVPQSYLNQFGFIDDDEGMCQAQTDNIVSPNKTAPPYSCRRQYHGMVKLLDDILGSLVDRLKEHGMWENTLMVVTSDNGGPINPGESAATNFPLRGGKYSDFEGGVRATAFVSGGYIPNERRGKVVRDPIHICDWYATLPALAGVDVEQEESKVTDDKKVPPVDAVNIWSLIVGGHDLPGYTYEDSDKAKAPSRAAPPRLEIPLSPHALIVGEYKLIWNDSRNISRSGWTYPTYPNNTTKPEEIDNQSVDCSNGCLFNVEKDPGEHADVASIEPVRLQQMKRRLQDLRKGFFDNDERGIDSCPKGYNDDDKSLPCACWMAVNYYGGFLGPYQEVDILAKAIVSKG